MKNKRKTVIIGTIVCIAIIGVQYFTWTIIGGMMLRVQNQKRVKYVEKV